MDLKIRANDAETSEYYAPVFSDLKSQGVTTPSQGGRNALIRGSRLSKKSKVVKFRFKGVTNPCDSKLIKLRS